MDLQLEDPETLKNDLLQLLLKYPNGVMFGNFIGAFHQLHRYHPQFSCYGYHSLRDLLDDMKEAVVVEGSSNNAVMKLANGFNLNGWMEKGRDILEEEDPSLLDMIEEGDPSLLDTIEERDPSLKDERGEGAGLADVLAALTSILKEYKSGLMVKKMQKLLLSRYGIDLERFSNSKGYKDTLMFLGCQIPYLNIKYQEDVSRCVVQLTEDPTVSSVPILSILQLYPNGLKMRKLKEAVKKNCGFDLEVFCFQLGYENVVSYLKEIPGPCSPASSIDTDCSAWSANTTSQTLITKTSGSSSPAPSLDSDFSDNISNALPPKLVMKKTELAAALVPLLDVLRGYPSGMNLKTLKNYLKKRGFDLTAFSQDMDYDDEMSCLLDLPGLELSFCNGNQPSDCVIKLLSSSLDLPCLAPCADISGDKCLSSGGSNISLELMETEPTSCSSTVFQFGDFLSSSSDESTSKAAPLNGNMLEKNLNSLTCVPSQFNNPLPCGSEYAPYKSKDSNQEKLEKNPALTEVMASLTSLLIKYKYGLRVEKVQEFLLAMEGIDLEKFSIAQGHKDTLEFLELRIPKLNLKYRNNRLKSVVWLGAGDTALTEVVASLTSLLIKYKFGLRVEKVQEFLLAMKGIDLKKFSIAQGHKDTLEFLELQIPKLNLKYRNNRLKSVVWLGAGDISKPALTFSDSSASHSQNESLTVPVPVVSPEVNKWLHNSKTVSSAMMPNLSSFQEPHDDSSVIAKNSSVPLTSILPQQPKACDFGAESLVEGIPSNSSLTTSWSTAGLDELKQQVSQILALHPKGLSLFQFRAAYSATFEQHFPIGRASSVKQCLLEMTDVVCLKGHGVQILLLPVSSAALPIKSGQPVSSKVENSAVVSCLPLLKTGAAVKPLAQVPRGPQPNPCCTLALDSLGETEVKDRCIPEDLPLREPQRIPARKEQGMARTGFRDLSHQSDLSKVQKVTNGYSLPKDDPQVVPQSRMTPAIPKAAVMSQPCHFLLPSPESVREPENNKRNSLFPDLPWDIPVSTVQDNPIKIPFTPHSSALFPRPPQGLFCGNSSQLGVLSFRPAPLTHSQFSDNSVLSPSTCHPVSSSSFAAWQQPVFCSSAPFHPGNSAPVTPVSVNCSGSQFPKSTSQSSYCDSSAQPQSPIHIAEQKNWDHVLLGLDPFSQMQEQSRTLQHPLNSVPDSFVQGHSVSSWSTNSASLSPSRSKGNKQYTRVSLDDLQHSSVSLSYESLMKTSLDREPSKQSAATYLEESADVNPLVTSSSTGSFSSYFTNGFQQPLLATSSITGNSRANSSVSLGMNAVSSVSSHQESTTDSPGELAYASARITSNSSATSSETCIFTHQRQYANASATAVSPSKMSRSSVPSPLHSTSNLSYSSSAGMNYGPLKQNDLKLTFSSQEDHSFVPPQMSYYSPPQNSHPPKSNDRCLIL